MIHTRMRRLNRGKEEKEMNSNWRNTKKRRPRRGKSIRKRSNSHWLRLPLTVERLCKCQQRWLNGDNISSQCMFNWVDFLKTQFRLFQKREDFMRVKSIGMRIQTQFQVHLSRMEDTWPLPRQSMPQIKPLTLPKNQKATLVLTSIMPRTQIQSSQCLNKPKMFRSNNLSIKVPKCCRWLQFLDRL